MKKTVIIFGCMVFALTGVGFAQTPPPVRLASAPAMAMHHKREHYPEIHRAMRKLRGAKNDLEKAARDYGGHRVKAIEAINEALAQLREALQSDKQ